MGPCTSLEELYKFNIARKAWSSVPIHGETPVSRTDYSGVLYRDDFYVYGERGESGHNRNDLKFNFGVSRKMFLLMLEMMMRWDFSWLLISKGARDF
ncbi:hypothetical protein F443_19145 [Phytophthora nicotianae P1569]|uniref:Uncharacterized protein n=1 Tax=Phytophthora nicotianae P1569 TaxID=1317065 RepID=V9E5X0_PHYNI|nr:hypothetical protein F443_19145 [Phytophthora nicotianae P1569]